MNKTRFCGLTFRASALLLLITALAKIYTLTEGSKVFSSQDPILGISTRTLMELAATMEFIASIILISGVSIRVRAWTMVLMGSAFVGYRMTRWWLKVPGTCACLGSLTERLKVSEALANRFLFAVACGLILFGLACLLHDRVDRSTARFPDIDRNPH